MQESEIDLDWGRTDRCEGDILERLMEKVFKSIWNGSHRTNGILILTDKNTQ